TVNGKSILIDGGADPARLLRYIRAHPDISPDIRIVIMTSADVDHHGALARQIDSWRPREFWGPTTLGQAAGGYVRLVRQLCVHTIMHCTEASPCRPNQRFTPESIPEVDIVVLDGGDISDARPSLVVRVEIGDERILFTGDIYGKRPADDAQMP